MKKIILIILLTLSLCVFSQEPIQFERTYTRVEYTHKGKQKNIKAKNIVIFNYGHSSFMKIYMADNNIRFFEQTSIRIEGVNHRGKYDSASFKEIGKSFTFTIKLFLEREQGCIFEFDDGSWVRFIE